MALVAREKGGESEARRRRKEGISRGKWVSLHSRKVSMALTA